MSDVTTRTFAAGRYVVERELARGGMATILLARDRELDRPVAVKVLDARLVDDPDVAGRFRREALTAASLAHPNVVQVYDAGEERGEPFIVMEVVEGEPLDVVLAREGRLEPERVRELGVQAAEALGHAHERGVVHRDVKPANLLLRGDGLLKVTDFGIARALDATTQLTEVGTLLGTALYVAPEQARGEPAGPPADVFSLGVVLYETLTGRVPWPIENLSELSSVAASPARPAGELAPGTPDDLEAAIMHALARNPEYRPPNANALAAELRGGGARGPGRPTRRRRPSSSPLRRTSRRGTAPRHAPAGTSWPRRSPSRCSRRSRRSRSAAAKIRLRLPSSRPRRSTTRSTSPAATRSGSAT